MIILHQAQPERIEYSVQCDENNISSITIVLMASDTLMPLLIVYRKTIDDAIWNERWRDGQDFLICSKDTLYVTREIFKEYITNVFFWIYRHKKNIGEFQ
jgi:hypothetical protein